MNDLVHKLLKVHREGDVIVAEGELDLTGGPVLEQVLHGCEAAGESIAIDLSRVTFVDSSGLRCLIGASQRSAFRGGRVRLIAPNAVVRRLLEITATTMMFDVE
jgi:anti-sigma B factor antagonist